MNTQVRGEALTLTGQICTLAFTPAGSVAIYSADRDRAGAGRAPARSGQLRCPRSKRPRSQGQVKSQVKSSLRRKERSFAKLHKKRYPKQRASHRAAQVGASDNAALCKIAKLQELFGQQSRRPAAQGTKNRRLDKTQPRETESPGGHHNSGNRANRRRGKPGERRRHHRVGSIHERRPPATGRKPERAGTRRKLRHHP
jgi:hypothetical protein